MAEFAGRTALAIRRRAVLPEERTLRRTISKLTGGHRRRAGR
jgi:hypothetical protein